MTTKNLIQHSPEMLNRDKINPLAPSVSISEEDDNVVITYKPDFPDTAAEFIVADDATLEEIELLADNMKANPNILKISFQIIDDHPFKKELLKIRDDIVKTINENITAATAALELIDEATDNGLTLNDDQKSFIQERIPAIVDFYKYNVHKHIMKTEKHCFEQNGFDECEELMLQDISNLGFNLPDKYSWFKEKRPIPNDGVKTRYVAMGIKNTPPPSVN